MNSIWKIVFIYMLYQILTKPAVSGRFGHCFFDIVIKMCDAVIIMFCVKNILFRNKTKCVVAYLTDLLSVFNLFILWKKWQNCWNCLEEITKPSIVCGINKTLFKIWFKNWFWGFLNPCEKDSKHHWWKRANFKMTGKTKKCPSHLKW